MTDGSTDNTTRQKMDFFTTSNLSKDDDDQPLEPESLERNVASLIALSKSKQLLRNVRETLKNLEALLGAYETNFEDLFGEEQVETTIGLLQKHYPPVFVYKTCRVLSSCLNVKYMQHILEECKQEMKSLDTNSSLEATSAKLDGLVEEIKKAARLLEKIRSLENKD